MTDVLRLTPAEKPDQLLGTIVLLGDEVQFTGGTEPIFRSYQRRLKGNANDRQTFDILKEGWSNGYLSLTPATPTKE